MMKKIVFSLFAMSICVLLNAQDDNNLVENPGFEQTEGKIRRGGAIAVAIGWMSPTGAAADLFSGKVKEGFGTPDNTYGSEAPDGSDNNNYAGIRVFSYGDKEPRQYISTKLKLPLRKDAKYCVTFYVNLAEGSKYAANNIGVNFSKKQYNINESKSIMTQTHVMHQDNPVFNAFFGWEQICGIYQAEGGEKFLTIGNFFANGETKNERLKKPKDFMGTSVVSAYYYVDNISVVMIDEDEECKCQADEAEPESTFIYEVAPINAEGLKPAQVFNFTTVYFGYGKAKLTIGADGHLQNIADVLLANDNAKVRISAHMDSDEVGSGKHDGLDMERAQAAKEWLVEKGIRPERILVDTKGDAMPDDNSGTELGQAKNRRLTFTYIE